ncbi:MAG TPA: SDR family NAD(P)-dependent oxidoreductase [Usitatibacter sp.]|nr:SDR family NAD(P)-dependent oxidoreductase [Usitatibacter sp.]
MADLARRHAIVTGGGRGIGAAITKALREAGARVTVMGRTRIAHESWIECDVADEASVKRAFAQAGPAAILVNNAGQADAAPFLKTELELWRRMLDVNLTGTFLCTQAALPDMLAARFGRVVNIASIAGLEGMSHVSAYCAAKHGVVGLTRSLAKELAKDCVTVNAVCPGYVETDMVKKAVANLMARGGSEAEARARLGRIIRPEEVAEVVMRLCESASQVTGQAIRLGGEAA